MVSRHLLSMWTMDLLIELGVLTFSSRKFADLSIFSRLRSFGVDVQKIIAVRTLIKSPAEIFY